MPGACLPPVSFSVREADPNFCPQFRAIGNTFDVLLDGVEPTGVISYDCEEGWLRRFRTDDAGKIILNLAEDAAEDETLHGVVMVRWRPANR